MGLLATTATTRRREGIFRLTKAFRESREAIQAPRRGIEVGIEEGVGVP